MNKKIFGMMVATTLSGAVMVTAGTAMAAGKCVHTCKGHAACAGDKKGKNECGGQGKVPAECKSQKDEAACGKKADKCKWDPKAP